jgi:tetratricopeptide (TPR) repeat protein
VQTAAVIGTEVPLSLLQAIAEWPEATLHRGLAHLQAAELLYETRLFPEYEYTFKHALTHEVAYSSVLQERRRVLHARIVEALGALAGDRVAEQVERLAHHALRGEVWGKALVYCRQAGEKAMTRSAYWEAAGSFEQALAALHRLPARPDTQAQAIDLHLALRNALWPLCEFERIRGSLQDAAVLAETLGDHHRQGWVVAYLAMQWAFAGDLDRALPAGQRALALATAQGDVRLTITAQYYLGLVYYSLGDYRRAVEAFRTSVMHLHEALLYERFGLTGLTSAGAYSMLSCALTACGDFAAGRVPAEEGVRIAEAADHPYSRGHAYWAVGFRLLCQGALPQAIPMLERAFDLVQQAPFRLLIPRTAATLGTAYALAGRTAEALPLLEQAVEQARALRILHYYALQVAWLGEAYLRAGRLEETYTQGQHALEFARTHKERGHEAYALRLLGEIHARRAPAEVEAAETHYRQALALAEELGMRPLQAHCHRGLGMLYATTGQREQARTELSAAVDLYQAMEMTFWLPETETALAQIEGH